MAIGLDRRMLDAFEKRDIEAVKALLDEGIELNVTSNNDTYLDWAWSGFKNYSFDIVKLLIEHGADLHDKKNPSIVSAARFGTLRDFQYLLERGADINAKNHVGSSALSKAVSWGNQKGIDALLELGIDVSKHGGEALRDAAWKGRFKVVQLLVEKGADINFHGKNMVFPYGSTPLQNAAGTGHLKIVQYLLEQGANLTIKDKYGERPYTEAKRYKHMEVMELIKSYEPQELHDLEKKIAELKKAGLPKPIIIDLGETRRRVELPDCNSVDYIEFCSIQDVTEMEVEGVRLINLVYDMDNYSELGMFVWIPSRKAIGSYDVEHENVMVIHDATWKKLQKDPGYYIDRVLDGEYDLS